MTLGSLFDGAGTVPFAAALCGIETLWSSEIEKFPLEVTAKRFPYVKQLGDITKIKGDEIEPVDIISFGSPCQDLSVAGKGAGLAGERSGLFMEAIRIIKEMRLKTNGRYPNYAIFENVPGAFSSNNGEDFRTVLEEFCKIKDSGAHVPRPTREEKCVWSDAGEIVGDGYSIAWRVLDAQFWGVPQRRRRVFLIGSFADECAGEILFEREGLSRHFKEIKRAWESTSEDIGNCLVSADRACFKKQGHAKFPGDGQGWERTELNDTLNAFDNSESFTPTLAVENHGQDCRWKISKDDVCQTLASNMGMGGNNVPLVMKMRAGCEGGGKGALIQTNKSATLSCSNDQTLFEPICVATQQGSAEIAENLCPTITAAAGMSGNNQPYVCLPQSEIYAVDQGGGKSQCSVSKDVSPTLTCTHGGEPAICQYESIQYGADFYNGAVSEESPTLGENCGMSTGRNGVVEFKTYGICSKESNAMKSDNPNSSIYEADTSRTLDCNGGNPACNQGGIAIVEMKNSDKGKVIGFHGTQDPVYLEEKTPCLSQGTSNGAGSLCVMVENKDSSENPDDSACIGFIGRAGATADISCGNEVSPTLRASMTTDVCYNPAKGLDDSEDVVCISGNMIGRKVENGPNGSGITENQSFTITATDRHAIAYQPNVINLNKDDVQSKAVLDPDGIAPSLYAGECRGGGGEMYVMESRDAQGLGAVGFYPQQKAEGMVPSIEKSPTLVNGTNPGWQNGVIENGYVVRRLTPTECARLQGMPDWWCADVPHTDSAEYKMWGNGMALPNMLYIMEGVAKAGAK